MKAKIFKRKFIILFGAIAALVLLWIFVRNNSRPHLLTAIARHDHKQLLDALKEGREDVNRKYQAVFSSRGFYLLERAIDEQDDFAVRQLLQAGARTDVLSDDLVGYSMLMCAVHYGCDKCVKILLQAGADINYVSSYDGRTALYVASSFHKSAMEELLKYHPNANAVDHKGWSALHAACAFSTISPNRREEIIKLLLDYGVDASLKDQKGRTARELLLQTDPKFVEHFDALLLRSRRVKN